MVREGDMAFSDAYLEGGWTSPDLQSFLDVVLDNNREVAHGFPGMGLVRLFERFRPGNWDIRFNQLFKHDIGQSAQSGLQFESRFLLTYRFTEDHELGVESFNDFSRLRDLSGYSAQSHSDLISSGSTSPRIVVKDSVSPRSP